MIKLSIKSFSKFSFKFSFKLLFKLPFKLPFRPSIKHFPLLMKVLKVSVISLPLFIIPLKLYASDNHTISPLARVADAQVFAEFTDKYPIVLNYFTSESDVNIINFYQEKYGDIASRSLKRERLTLFFTHNKNRIRVVISQQNNKRQVDVLSELISEIAP